MIRTRIAPSPTGNLHIGTARTALFNYLFAKKMGGKFIVRIEDTDLERSSRKFEKDILAGLAWLSIEADESPVAGGKFGPYRQSERTETYRKNLEILLSGGLAFYCFHSQKELLEERESLMKSKKPPVHLCEYRNMGPQESEIFKEAKRDYIIRFKNHVGRQIFFHDLIRGDLTFESDLIGDFSIAKRIDIPLYNFAVVVDDETMQISHCIRGEDHLSNTPKQILLIEALGFKKPKYAHLPLILGLDRSKLSKRHGATSVGEYKEMGYLPEAMFNFMSLLGWNPGDDREILPKEELIKLFSLEKVQKSGAIFDINKLDWMNGEYIRRKSLAELSELSRPFLKNFLRGSKSKEHIEKILAVEQPRLKKLSDLPEKTDYFFKEPKYERGLLRWKKMTDDEISSSLNLAIGLLKENKSLEIEKLEKVFLEEAQKMGDRGLLFWPLRVALSGKEASAGPFEIIKILGIEKTAARLKYALKLFS